jgi:hypothetical protein
VTPSGLLARCRALGIDIAAGPGGALVIEASTDPPADLLKALKDHKSAVLGLLITAARPLDEPECWRCLRLTGSAFVCDCPGRRATTASWATTADRSQADPDDNDGF